MEQLPNTHSLSHLCAWDKINVYSLHNNSHKHTQICKMKKKYTQRQKVQRCMQLKEEQELGRATGPFDYISLICTA